VEKGANHNFSNLFCEHGLLVALQIQYIAQEKQLPSFLTKSYSSILKKTKVFHYRKILQNLLRQKKHSLGTTRLDGPFFNQKTVLLLSLLLHVSLDSSKHSIIE